MLESAGHSSVRIVRVSATGATYTPGPSHIPICWQQNKACTLEYGKDSPSFYGGFAGSLHYPLLTKPNNKLTGRGFRVQIQYHKARKRRVDLELR